MVEIAYTCSVLTWRMGWAVHYLLLLLPTALSYVDSGRILPPVFWNTSNSMFQSSNTNHLIDVNLGDSLEVLCPYYTDNTPVSKMEYYLIYMVDQYSYNVCIINDAAKSNLILNCSNPEQRKSFTLLIFEFQPVPGITDFRLGKDYYFISTSSGTKNTMDNQYEGACKDNQMKMVLRVRPTEKEVVPDPNNNQSPSGGNAEVTTTRPPVPPTTTSTTTTTTTSTTTTTTSQLPTTSFFQRRPTAKDPEDKMPGSDGFPADEKVIQAGDKLNSGIIADGNGLENSGLSLHSLKGHLCFYLCFLPVTILITCYTLSVR